MIELLETKNNEDRRQHTLPLRQRGKIQTFRHEIDVRLGGGARFKVDEIQDLDSMMSKSPAGTTGRKKSKEHEALMQHPEIQEQIAGMICKHWESWVDQNIPALGGKSPRDAVKTADGREAVEALLQDAVRDRRQDPFTAEANRKGSQRARELLGLNHQ